MPQYMSAYVRAVMVLVVAVILIAAVYPPGGKAPTTSNAATKLALSKIKDELKLELKNELKLEMKQEVKQELQQEVAQEVKQELQQEVTQGVKQDVKEEVLHVVKKEIVESSEAIQVRPNFLEPEMAEVIKQRAIDGDIVFLSGDYKYREILLNWIVVAETKNVTNWIISCYDNDLKTWLEERGLTCHILIPKEFTSMALVEFEVLHDRSCRGQEGGLPLTADSLEECMHKACSRILTTDCIGVSYTNSTKSCVKCRGDVRVDFVSGLAAKGTDVGLYVGKDRIWHLRWRAAMDVFALGINVVFSDLDALVVQDFFPYIRGLNTDVVAQRGYGPAKAAAFWGSSICMGFSYWKTGTWKRHEIIRSVNEILKKSGDDQNAVAIALLIEGVRFPVPTAVNDTESKIGVSPSGYSLALLPMTTFPRGDCEEGNMIPPKYIAHCVFGGTPAAKQRDIAKFGTWKLRDDYASFDHSNYTSFKQYISALHVDSPRPQ